MYSTAPVVRFSAVVPNLHSGVQETPKPTGLFDVRE
jgi:hypothetical protein